MENKSKSTSTEICNAFKQLTDLVVLRNEFDAFLGGYSFELETMIIPTDELRNYFSDWLKNFKYEMKHKPTYFECFVHGITKASNE